MGEPYRLGDNAGEIARRPDDRFEFKREFWQMYSGKERDSEAGLDSYR